MLSNSRLLLIITISDSYGNVHEHVHVTMACIYVEVKDNKDNL